MKQNVLEFVRRGLMAAGFGPLILVAVYLVLQDQAGVETLTVRQVCLGICSLTALAFIAGGMNLVYQVERLPLMAAISIHGGVLYVAYLVTYLLNDWLEWGAMPILVFTGIFLLGCQFFFLETVAEWGKALGFENAHAYMFLGLAGINFLIEIVVNIILAPVIVRLIKAGKA